MITTFRSGSSVMIRTNDLFKVITHQTEAEAQETFRQVMAIKQDPSEENMKKLMELIDPMYKIVQNEYLQKDRNGNIYLSGINVPLPQLLLQKVEEYINEGFDLTPLINFWRLLVLNPDIEVRDSLYDFASHFGFPITNNGYFIAYKSVYYAGKKHESLGLQVASKYVYIRADGKNPADYVVYKYEDDEEKVYEIIHKDDEKYYLDEFIEYSAELVSLKDLLNMCQEERDELEYDEENDIYFRAVPSGTLPTSIGTLEEVFKNIPSFFDNEEGFTDCYSRSMSIKLGKPVKMNRDKCDNNPENTCSKGLHVGTPQYVQQFGDNSKYILAVLVNPMNVVAVPNDYNGQKMRCCEYLPYAVCEIDADGHLKEINAKFFEEDYINYEIEDLEKMLVKETDEELIEQIKNRLIQLS